MLAEGLARWRFPAPASPTYLPVDDAGEDQGQARARVHLVVDLAGADAPPLPVVDGPRQGVELLDLEQAPPHLRPQLRLGHVLQHEFGLQRPAQLPVGGVEAVRGLEAVEPLQGARRRGVPGGERRVELADAVPLLGDEAEVHRAPAALEDRFEDAVVAARVGAVDPLAVEAADARAENRMPTIPKAAKLISVYPWVSV